MAKETIVFTAADEKLAHAITELNKKDFQEVKSYLTDPELRDVYLNSIENTATITKSTAEEVLENLKLVRTQGQ